MRFYLISDNVDTAVGMRLAGIEGEIVQEEAEVEKALNWALAQEDIGIILITGRLAELCPKLLQKIKKDNARPLILEIPDRHGMGGNDSISKYIREAIGIKV